MKIFATTRPSDLPIHMPDSNQKGVGEVWKIFMFNGGRKMHSEVPFLIYNFINIDTVKTQSLSTFPWAVIHERLTEEKSSYFVPC